jgi:hypothetical protein
MSDTTREALAPCPFCAHTTAPKVTAASELHGDEEGWYEHTESYAVICDASTPGGPGGCGCQGGFKPTPEAAIENWNRRAALGDVPAAPAERTQEEILAESAKRFLEREKRLADQADAADIRHWVAATPAAVPVQPRDCTCHPDDNPPKPCPQKYAYNECVVAVQQGREALSAEQIEKLAIEHEAFGFGQVDEWGLTTHGFDPDGLHDFVRAIAAALAPTPQAPQPTEPPGSLEEILEWIAYMTDDAPIRNMARAALDKLAASLLPAQAPAVPPEEAAELAELREANRMTPDHEQLAKFYGVTTYAGLVERQAHHIQKLQAKLPPTPNIFAPQRVREG